MNVFEKIKDRLKQRLLANDECRKTALSKHNFDSVKYFQSLMFEDETIISIIQEQAEAYNNGWISCSERLPEKHKDVLVTDGNDMMVWNLVEDYSGYSWEDEYGVWNDFERVIYWQPLPQPYKERDANGN